MGKALRDGYRQKVFLMTKFDGRTKKSTASQIDESLQRFQTDHVDLMQYHENIRMEDPDRFFAPDGPLEALLEAKKAGKIRYIGFTGHKDPAVHLRMLEVAEQNGFHFDSAQMPLNLLDAHFRSFAKLVVPKLVAQGIGVLGMKPMAFGNLPQHGLATGIECLHYALNLPTSVVITGCDTMERLHQALEAAKTFKPLTPAEICFPGSQDEGCRPDREIRAVQDYCPIRRNRAQARMDGLISWTSCRKRYRCRNHFKYSGRLWN